MMHLIKSNPASGPSRLGLWFLALFGPTEHGQAALGDLLEEFAHVRTQSGVSAAQRWFRYQALRTVIYLIGSEFRTAPFAIVAAAVFGFFLRGYISGLCNPAMNRATDALLRHYQVYELDPHVYIFWTIHIFYAEHFLVNTAVGVLVGILALKREMSAVITLALLGNMLAVVSVLGGVSRTGDTGLLWTVLWTFAFSVAMVAGGAMVRMRRMALTSAIRKLS